MQYFKRKRNEGFTLIETLVAISLLMLALVAPMSLAAQSLTAAYYARDQVTAFYLAQEGIEIVRSVRDANIIAIAKGNGSVDIFDGIPYGSDAADAPLFTVDAQIVNPQDSPINECQKEPSGRYRCPPLQTNGLLYGYAWPACEPTPSVGMYGTWTTTDCAGSDSAWTNTTFRRSIRAYLLNADDPDEMRVTVTVTWQEGSFQTQSFTINEDLYRWVNS